MAAAQMWAFFSRYREGNYIHPVGMELLLQVEGAPPGP
jgi:hypothetical protein